MANPDKNMIQDEIRNLMRTYESRVQVSLGVSMPPEMADRLQDLIIAVPGISRRDLVLTGVEIIMQTCEKSPDQIGAMLKIGAFESRAKVTGSVKSPPELDERLTRFVNSVPGVSRRDVTVGRVAEAWFPVRLPLAAKIHSAKRSSWLAKHQCRFWESGSREK
jgi:hypothetical protein